MSNPPFIYSNGDTGIDGSTGMGITGPQGETGVQGIQGPVGYRGQKGDTGLGGLKGDIGDTGLVGLRGFRGQQGETGIGSIGSTGIQGPIGPYGGPQGKIGSTGLQGPQGFQGETGICLGETGLQGLLGQQGETGLLGLQGETGICLGDTGETGLQGSQGDTGLLGLQGDTGQQGLQGETGLSGLDGLTGPQGDTGLRGPTGLVGDPLLIEDNTLYGYKIVNNTILATKISDDALDVMLRRSYITTINQIPSVVCPLNKVVHVAVDGVIIYAYGELVGLPGSGAVFKWDGGSWENISTSFGEYGIAVPHMVVYQNDLYVLNATETEVYKWDGTYWTILLGGSDFSDNLKVIDNVLYGSGLNGIASWDGSSWIPVCSLNEYGPIFAFNKLNGVWYCGISSGLLYVYEDSAWMFAGNTYGTNIDMVKHKDALYLCGYGFSDVYRNTGTGFDAIGGGSFRSLASNGDMLFGVTYAGLFRRLDGYIWTTISLGGDAFGVLELLGGALYVGGIFPEKIVNFSQSLKLTVVETVDFTVATGALVSAGDIVRQVSSVPFTVIPACADTLENSSGIVGVATEFKTEGQIVKVTMDKVVELTSSSPMTIGNTAYLSETELGKAVDTLPLGIVVRLGTVLDTKKVGPFIPIRL